MARTKKCPLTKEEQAIALSEVRRIRYEQECEETLRKVEGAIAQADKRYNGDHKEYTPRLLARADVRHLISLATYKAPEIKPVVWAKPDSIPDWAGMWLFVLSAFTVLSNLALWIRVSGG